MNLEPQHRRNLRERGLDDHIIDGNLYRSLPTDWRLRQQVTDRLASRYDLSGVPGFYLQDGGWRMTGFQTGGFLIPVCTKDNLIQGLQIRLDEAPPIWVPQPDGSVKQKKGERYRSFSSSHKKTGAASKCFIHVVGDQHSRTLYLTEGPSKSRYLQLSFRRRVVFRAGRRAKPEISGRYRPPIKAPHDCGVSGYGCPDEPGRTARTSQDTGYLYASLQRLPGIPLAFGEKGH